MEKKTTTITIIIFLSVIIGFASGLATWYMTHKHILYSLYTSMIIGFIVSIVYFLYVTKKKN